MERTAAWEMKSQLRSGKNWREQNHSNMKFTAPVARRTEGKFSASLPDKDKEETLKLNVEKTTAKSCPSKMSRKSDQSVISRSNASSKLKRKAQELEIEARRKLAALQEEAEMAELEVKKNKFLREKELLAMEVELQRITLEEGSVSDARSAKSRTEDIQEKIERTQDWVNEATKMSQDCVQRINCQRVFDSDRRIHRPQSQTHMFSSKTGAAETTELKHFLARQSLKTDLPPFAGNPIEWPHFINQLKETTEICGFTERENVNRLQKSLSGKARECVLALLNLPNSYDRIIATLERKFGRPDYIIEELIARVKRIRPVREDRLNDIIDFSNAVQNLTVTIISLECQYHLINPQLLRELLQKLPSSFRIQWGDQVRRSVGRSASLEDFAIWLEEIADSASFVSMPRPEEEHEKKRRDKEAALTLTEKTVDNFRDNCQFCKRFGHLVENCEQFKRRSNEERWKWVTENKLCFVCLKKGHRVNKCTKKKQCGKAQCTHLHHQLLHKNTSVANNPQAVREVSIERNCHSNCHSIDTTESMGKEASIYKVLLRIVPVILKGPRGEEHTYALFDEASTVTLLEDDLARKLGLNGFRDPLCMQWTNETTKFEESSRRVAVSISAANGKKFHKLNGVRTVQKLCLPTQTVDVTKLAEKYPYVKKVSIKNLYNARPKILIGQDNWSLIIARNLIYESNNGPVLSYTKLGWVIHGKIPEKDFLGIHSEYNLHICHHDSNEFDTLHQLVKNSFRTESFGVKAPEKELLSKEDEQAVNILETTTRRISNNRWETGLLWRYSTTTLPESKLNAWRRLLCMEKKMDNDSTFAEAYCRKIDEFVEKGYARKLSAVEALQTTSRTWYLPHFGVVNPNKPGKLRLVFDAAAKSHGVSLNSALLKGPDFLKNIVAIIWKFRQKRIAFGADIKEMFPQVRIRKEDVAAQRFLWRGKRRTGPADTYEMVAMIFGAVCSPSSAQFVKNKNAMEFEKQFPEAVDAILNKHYMDDYLDSTDTEETACKLIKEIITIHERGGFVLCNWISNSKEVLMKIPNHLRSQSNQDLNLDSESEMPTERILGLWWNPNNDDFRFKLCFRKIDKKVLEGTRAPTKREVLRIVMSIYDPLGFLASLVIHAKILLQEIWRIGIGWDEQLNEELNKKWSKWFSNLKMVEELRIPRCYSWSMSTASSIQLHVFCDASEKSFGTVAYYRIKKDHHIQVVFITAKTRVAPLKPMSIPRLELQAAVMASRLANTIRKEHEIKISKTWLWSDSKTVLCWLRSDARKFKQFVAHRIGEIEETTDLSDWRWVPTKENVADEATKWAKDFHLSSSSRWFSGPEFLKYEEDNWPVEVWTTEATTQDAELKKEFVALNSEIDKAEALPDIRRFSRYRRLIRTTAWMLRFINRIRRRILDPVHELLPDEIEAAESLWLQHVQKQDFENEINQLKNGLEVESKSRLKQLSPYLDAKGLLRIKGRIDAAEDVDDWTKRPIILDPKNVFTRLLVYEYHLQAGHHGREAVANELRQKYWILGIRNAVRLAWNSCQTCKNRRAKQTVPEMSPLPASRLQWRIQPFTCTGMDYFGPMLVTIGRHKEKRYGVLFTCLTTRAVHLEIAHSLTTDSAIMAIRRMIARRGCPKEIWSDNGTNFKGASREIREALKGLDQQKLTERCTSRGIKWTFIPPAAPHMGGCWERLVRSVKIALEATLKERAPKEEVLLTLIVEAENTVNSRPLTHLSVDPDDPECLTPNHFLRGASGTIDPLNISSEETVCLRKQWKIAQALASHFWKRWVKEYLPSLTKRTKWFRGSNRPVVIGDVVVLVNPDAPRNTWRKGRVINVYPGKDGQIRTVDVKTSSGVLKRPVVKICVLDVEKVDVDSQHQGGEMLRNEERTEED